MLFICNMSSFFRFFHLFNKKAGLVDYRLDGREGSIDCVFLKTAFVRGRGHPYISVIFFSCRYHCSLLVGEG